MLKLSNYKLSLEEIENKFTGDVRIFAPRKNVRQQTRRKLSSKRGTSLKIEAARLADIESVQMAETFRAAEQIEDAMWASLAIFESLEG